jgi:ubiquinone/menaquinone biosynthesis C-methylase UbiE
MAHGPDPTTIGEHWGRDGLGQRILDALAAAGKDLESLTVDDIAPADHFHGGGKPATDRLARLAAPPAETRVLDVGGGLGGPARTLAVKYGCRVTVLDLTESYVRAVELLTERLRLGDRVSHRVGNALELPFPAGAFDMVWTQNSGMNIADKERLYAGFHRVLRPSGVLAFQEPMAGPGGPPIFPTMWARDASQSFLRSPDAMRALIEAAGFRVRTWDDVTADTSVATPPAALPAYAISKLVMGDALPAIMAAGQRSRDERRVLMIHAVCDRP